MADCDNFSIRNCDKPSDGRSALTLSAIPVASVKTRLKTLGEIQTPDRLVRSWVAEPKFGVIKEEPKGRPLPRLHDNARPRITQIHKNPAKFYAIAALAVPSVCSM
jgi:hypothetical protein